MNWLTPFSIVTGLGVVIGYSRLGSTWLTLKTEGALQRTMIRITRPITIAVLVSIVIVSIWTPLNHPATADRWFSLPT